MATRGMNSKSTNKLHKDSIKMHVKNATTTASIPNILSSEWVFTAADCRMVLDFVALFLIGKRTYDAHRRKGKNISLAECNGKCIRNAKS